MLSRRLGAARMRASKGKGREEPDRVRKPRVSFRPKAAAVAAAAPFVVVCLVPIVLWGNPYPPKILTYWLGGSALAAIIAALVANLPSFSIDRLIALSKRATSSLSPGRFAALVGAATAAIAFAMSSVVFQHAASTSDELAQLWHAQVLLTGHLFLPVDPNREFFALETVVDSGKWYSQFPIGGPAVLTLGALVGKPWLVNPILAAGACMLLYHFGRRAFGEAHGRAIAALFALSPMIVMMSGTWMNHVPTLFLATAALAALVEWERATTRVRAHLFAALVGLAVGLMLTIRPVDAAVAAVAIAVFQLAEAARTPR